MNRFQFRTQILLRLGGILVFGYGAFYVVTETPFWLLTFWLILFAVLVFVDLIRFIERSNRELSNFLMAIRQNDFSNVYPERHSRTKSLYHAFNVITREFIKIRSEKESNFHFLQTIVEHSGVPLLAYDLKTLKVSIINQSAKDLFHIPHLTKTSALERVSEELRMNVETLESDEKILLKVEIRGELFYLSLIAKEIVLQETRFKVVAFHNINSELDQKEIESWQKLIRVLTHEIKNSVIPISTLSEVINQMVTTKDGEPISMTALSEEDAEDLRTSLQTIEKRSKGLVRFVASYGDLARVPKPEFEKCDLSELIRRVVDLESSIARSNGITIKTMLPSNGSLVNIDPQLIEQVLINIVKNALEVLYGQENGIIEITLSGHDQKTIKVFDNGPGMDAETLDNIFVPFFTTKQEGTGIGLSLARQIIRAHKGNLRVVSHPGQGATFEIVL